MMSGPRWLMVVLIGLVTLRLLGSIGAEEVSDARLLNAYQDATNWLLYGRDYSNQRYSPLDQIKVGNVKTLIPKWAYRTGKVGPFQTSPLAVDGVMYATTPFNHVVALDARNGTQIWRYQDTLRTGKGCWGPGDRGGAVGYGEGDTTPSDAPLLAPYQKARRAGRESGAPRRRMAQTFIVTRQRKRRPSRSSRILGRQAGAPSGPPPRSTRS